MSHEKLCPELFDYIIDFLHGDETVLRTCALVCRSWVPTCRIHLFHTLGLTGCPSKDTHSGWAPNTGCRRIYATLIASPHLAGYINKVSVTEASIYQPANYRWVSGEIMFPPLLKKLLAVEELEFNFPVPESSEPKTVWSTMVFKDINEAMKTLRLRSFSLRQFAFTSLADFIKALESWKYLKTLVLDGVDVLTASQLSASALDHVIGIQTLSPTQTREHEPKATLQHLLLRSDSSAFFIPIMLDRRSPIDLSNLTSLIINITSDNYANVLELFKNTPNIEILELEIDKLFDYEKQLDSKGVIDLRSMPSLKKFSLQISLLLGRIEPMSWMIPFFSTATSANVLADLSLKCVVVKPTPTVTIQALDNSLAGWRAFDDLLSQQTFASLKRFRLDFALDDSQVGDESVQEMSSEYIKQLPTLGGKGVLEVYK